MGRPKGSRNKAGLKKGYGDGLRGHLLRVFERTFVGKIEELSVRSGIAIREVCNDMAAEGLTCLEEDAYKSLIEFRERRGKLIHERELVQASEAGKGARPGKGEEEQGELLEQVPVEAAPATDTTGLDDAVERPRQPTENREDSLVSDPGEGVVANDEALPL